MSQPPIRKPISRSFQTNPPTSSQRSSRQKLPSYSVNNSYNIQQSNQQTLQSNNRQTSINKQKQKQKQSFNEQKQQKNIFYSQLRIQTNDVDVPLVKILKVNQQLLKKFIYYSSACQHIMKNMRIRSLVNGFRGLGKIQFEGNKDEIIITEIIKEKDRIRTNQIIWTKEQIENKIEINNSNKQINNKWFMKNCIQKKLLNIVISKVDEDELIKMKMNLQIFRQISFSRQFISKCRGLIKYNVNNKNMFDKQLIKINFQQLLISELQRYQKIRQNVNNINPSIEQSNVKNINNNINNNNINKGSSSTAIKRKSTISSTNNDNNYYQNEIVLLAIKSFNLSLLDTRQSYQLQINRLQQQINELQTQQRYIQLSIKLNQTININKSYQSIINQFYNKADQQINKIITSSLLLKIIFISYVYLTCLLQDKQKRIE